jgi:hypothetical protein
MNLNVIKFATNVKEESYDILDKHSVFLGHAFISRCKYLTYFGCCCYHHFYRMSVEDLNEIRRKEGLAKKESEEKNYKKQAKN